MSDKDNYGDKVRLSDACLVSRHKDENLELLCWNCQRIYEYETGRISEEVIELVQDYIQKWVG